MPTQPAPCRPGTRSRVDRVEVGSWTEQFEVSIRYMVVQSEPLRTFVIANSDHPNLTEARVLRRVVARTEHA